MLPDQFKEFMEMLRAELESLRISRQEQIGSIRATGEAQRKVQESIRVALLESRIPDDEKKDSRSYRKKNYTVQVILTVGTCGAFLAAAIYAAIAYRQLGKMTDATTATQHAAYSACVSAQIARNTLLEIQAGRNDSHDLAVGSITQAAAVTRAEAAQMEEVSGDKRIDWNVDPNNGIIVFLWDVRNVGKSSALNVKMKAQVSILELGIEPDFHYRLPPINTIRTGSYFPDQNKEWQLKISDKNGNRMVRTDPMFIDLNKGHGYLSVYGRVIYQDVFGAPHWLQFCSHHMFPMRETDAKFPKCAAYNQTDEGSLPKKVTNDTVPVPTTPPEITCKAPEEKK